MLWLEAASRVYLNRRRLFDCFVNLGSTVTPLSSSHFLGLAHLLASAGLNSNVITRPVVVAVVKCLFHEQVKALQVLRTGRRKQKLSEDLAIYLLVNFNHRFEVR
jgi:hypothetical protein